MGGQGKPDHGGAFASCSSASSLLGLQWGSPNPTGGYREDARPRQGPWGWGQRGHRLGQRKEVHWAQFRLGPSKWGHEVQSLQVQCPEAHDLGEPGRHRCSSWVLMCSSCSRSCRKEGRVAASSCQQFFITS